MKEKCKKLIYIHVFTLIIIIMMGAIVKTKLINFVPKCYIYERFHIYCPGCGGTRFIINLFNLNIKEAFISHHILFFSFIYAIVFDLTLIYGVLQNKKLNIFRWWHVIIWGICMIGYMLIRNIS